MDLVYSCCALVVLILWEDERVTFRFVLSRGWSSTSTWSHCFISWETGSNSPRHKNCLLLFSLPSVFLGSLIRVIFFRDWHWEGNLSREPWDRKWSLGNERRSPDWNRWLAGLHMPSARQYQWQVLSSTALLASLRDMK